MNSKKDPNYIAALEKAISEKYGKDTVQDFRNTWEEDKEKEYLEQLKILQTKLDVFKENQEEVIIGDVKIRKRRRDQNEDRTCPVCKTYSFSRSDDLYMNRFKSCYSCYVDFIVGREDAWSNGNRPTQEYLEYAIATRRRK
tara:strand:- start:8862 stop:9284 length:423 start_codon:yes stop_codon:yes gene_type:complete